MSNWLTGMSLEHTTWRMKPSIGTSQLDGQTDLRNQDQDLIIGVMDTDGSNMWGRDILDWDTWHFYRSE